MRYGIPVVPALLALLILPTVPANSSSLDPATALPGPAASLSVTPAGDQNATPGPVSRELRARLADAPRQLQVGSIRLLEPGRLAKFYQQRQYRPAWLDAAGRPSPLAERLLALIDAAGDEGLRPQDYHSRELLFALRGLQIAYATTPPQLANFDLLLSDAFLGYAAQLLDGHVDPHRLDPHWRLQPRQHDLTALLETALQRRNLAAELQQLAPPYAGYVRLRQALLQYRRIAVHGGWPTITAGPKLELGSSGERAQQLRTRLQASGDLDPATQPVADPALVDQTVAAAIRHFQTRHGLASDGVVGPRTLAELNEPVSSRIRQIELNLERWRWLPADLGQRHIIVNVPGFQLRVVDHGQVVLRSKVIVGQPKRPTPLFSAEMRYIVFSPYWHVPYTIAVKDKLPLLRKNPYALRRDGIRVFVDGHQIDPGKINWHAVTAHTFHYTLRQDPGPHNALGGIKFMFPNPYSVYIHDTPSRYLFAHARRAFSSGCIRTDSPVELAQYLLRAQPEWDRARIVAAAERGEARRVDLAHPIPVYVLYFTAWVDADGTVQFRDDIYNRDVALARAFFTG